MNQKLYSIVFCVLVASTLVHELRAKSVVPVNNLAIEDPQPIKRIKRSSLNTPGLSITAVGEVLIIVNSTADAAILIDVSAKVFLLLNGTSGSGVCVDPVNKKGSYIKGGLWNATEEALEDFVESLDGGIKGLLTVVGAVLFKLGVVNKVILQEITNIVICLVLFIECELMLDLALSLNLVIALVLDLFVLLDGVLNGLLVLLVGIKISLYVDICGLLHILEGLAYIIKLVAGTLQACIVKQVEFDLALILGATNGVVCLINIILQLGAKFVLTALVNVLGTVESLFKLIAKLGGNCPIGITGVFKVVAEIVAFINGNATLEVVISSLIQYVVLSSKCITVDLSAELIAVLNVLLCALETVNATELLSGLVKIIKDLIGGVLTVGGINIAKIIFRLLAGILVVADKLLCLVVEILLLLLGIVDVILCIPYLLLVLICKLYSPCGIYELLALGIKLNLNLSDIVFGLLKTTLLSVKNLLKLLLGNLYEVLLDIPLIGDIVEALNDALEECSEGKYSLKKLLNGSLQVQLLIKALIRLVTGILVPGTNLLLAQIKIILTNVTSISLFLGIDIVAIITIG